MTRSILLAILAALTTAMAFPPYDVAAAVAAGPALLVVAVLVAPSRKAAVAAGLVFGGVYIGFLMYWMSNLGREAIAGLILAQVGFYAVFSLVLWGFKDHSAWEVAAIVIGGWSAMEFARERGPFGGLSWGAVGYPLGDFEVTRAVAGWVGTSGLGVLVMSLAAGMALAVLRKDPRPLGLASLVVLVALGVGATTGHETGGGAVDVAIVQGNSPCPGASCPNERTIIFENHLVLTSRLPAGAFDLVVWPESSTGFGTDPLVSSVVATALADQARRLDSYLVIGGDRPADPGFFVNSNLFYDRSGNLIAEYRKNHPVPFGEYIPVRDLIGDLLPVLSRVPLDMVRGDGPVVVDADFGQVGSVISYEGSFARYVREAVRAGAEVIVVASNEASYGDSPAARQFIGMTRMRAAENGVDIVHGAVTGSSTLITDGGRLGRITDLYSEDVVVGTVRLRTGELTLFTRWGDWFAVAAMVAASVAVVWRGLTSGIERQIEKGRLKETALPAGSEVK
ncbi:MAG: apolipoprotein N-acyltransferase [Acidimicrobiia bacterium]|nr:apolipoprotein N-acyltransferase [Acidimicrobiia bacterium]